MFLSKVIKQNLKLIYHYDILCPHSYLGFQMINKKLTSWKAKMDLDIDYIPVLGPKIFRCCHGSLYDGLNNYKRDYIIKELKLITDLYQLKGPDEFYWGCDLLDKRSVSALLLLVQLRRDKPELYITFLKDFFDRIWLKNVNINRVSVFFKIGRELGIEWKVMDELISKIESPDNVSELIGKTNELTLRNALSSPWIMFGNDTHCIETNEIMRLEMIEHFMDHPEHLPLMRPIPDGKREHYVSPKSTFIEDYSC